MFTEITECRCCGEGDLYQYIDLSDQPLANSYHKEGEVQMTFPLRANLCKKCFHTQLSVVVDPEIMFKHYLYVSGISKTLVKYFDDFAGWSMKWSGMDRVNRPVRVLDIACFPAGHMVTTSNGLVPIEEVQMGNKVLTHTGVKKRVIQTFARHYTGDVYTLRAKGYSFGITATSEHPFLTQRGWVPIKNIVPGDVCYIQSSTSIEYNNGEIIDVESILRKYHPTTITTDDVTYGLILMD
jgi:hypothetical protein